MQINRLLEDGVLCEGRREGNQRRIAANTEYFLYTELRTIAMKSFGLAFPLREALQEHAPQVREAFVFGPIVEGTDTATSEINLLVIGPMPASSSDGLTTALAHVLGRPIQVSAYDENEWKHLAEVDPVVSRIAAAPKLCVLP